MKQINKITHVFFYVIILVYTFSFYFIIKKIKIYWINFYEYYVGSIVLTNLIKEFQVQSIIYFFQNSFVQRLLFIRPLILFLIFKPTQELFFFSNILLNATLGIWLFFELKKIISPIKSFFLMSVIMSSYLFLVESLNYQLNTTIMLLYSIFFILIKELLIQAKIKKIICLKLIIIVFLLYFAKHTAYIILPIIYFGLFVDSLFLNKQRFKRILFLFFLSAIGFLVYFSLFGFKISFLIERDIASTGINVTELRQENSELPVFVNFINKIKHNFTKVCFEFMNKYYSIIFSIILYLSVVIYRKKLSFWFLLFICSEVYLFILCNFSQITLAIRYFYPFTIIYLRFILELITFLILRIKHILKINKRIIFSFLLLVIIISNSVIFSIDLRKNNYSLPQIGPYFNMDCMTKIKTPPNSTIYITNFNSTCTKNILGIVGSNYLDFEIFNDSKIISIINKIKNNSSNNDLRFNFKLQPISIQNISNIKQNDFIMIPITQTINSSKFIYYSSVYCLGSCYFKIFKRSDNNT